MTWDREVLRVDSPPLAPGMNPQHRVRLLLEPGKWQEHDPFLLLAEDWFVRGTFGDHPHRGFETVTFVIEGSVEHADNHGGHGVLQPGDAQWMTAGRGVIHSEEAGPDGAHTLQLWINLPSRLKMAEPRYEDLRGAQMPVQSVDGGILRSFAPSIRHLPVTMLEMRLGPGATAAPEVPSAENAFLYVIAGAGRFGANARSANAGQVVWFERRDDGGGSRIVCKADEALHAILWSGPPLREPVAAHGPFVMNTQGELRQAFLDFQSGRF